MKGPHDESLSLVLVGGSSGSFVIFEEILKLLTNPISFAIIFVLHRGKSSSSLLPELFKSKTNMFMSEPHHLDQIMANSIYFAFPNYHLLVGDDQRFYYDVSEPDFFFTSVNKRYVCIGGAFRDYCKGGHAVFRFKPRWRGCDAIAGRNGRAYLCSGPGFCRISQDAAGGFVEIPKSHTVKTAKFLHRDQRNTL